MTPDDPRCVAETATILEALKAIDGNGLGLVLVADHEGRVAGTLSDGDIRRGLIRGLPLSAGVGPLANARFLSVSADATAAEIAQLMLARGLDVIPVLDDERRLLRVHTLTGLLRARPRAEAALIMAGGRGTRLEDLTHAIPKPMLPIGDKPLLERIVTHLVSHGIVRIYLSVHHMAQMIVDHFGDGARFNCSIEYLREDTPLGSGGGLTLLPPQDAPVLVMNGDLLTKLHIARLLDFHVERGAAITAGVRSWSQTIPFGVVTAEHGRVARVIEKPTVSHLVNAGIYVVSPDVLATLPRNAAFPITDMINGAVDRGLHVAAYRFEDEWVDIGVPSTYHEHAARS